MTNSEQNSTTISAVTNASLAVLGAGLILACIRTASGHFSATDTLTCGSMVIVAVLCVTSMIRADRKAAVTLLGVATTIAYVALATVMALHGS